ncbi:hypothetical protein QMO14_09505 [Variovorax sp. CAN2819]|uniref:hypothetical protein n=1 Tax=Variovorax sp. CAN15 TaxID=3046727 RepID=UPI00264904E8|nr:hypothetical protein [Variovorax sp. CAN15]MDN6883830.1 hypothetical protein [Variovorax sp. CAN15]
MRKPSSETPGQLLLALEQSAPPVPRAVEVQSNVVVHVHFGSKLSQRIAERATSVEESKIIESVLAQARKLSW